MNRFVIAAFGAVVMASTIPFAVQAQTAKERAQTQPFGPFGPRVIEQEDVDKDGFLSLEEFRSARSHRFGRIDADRDGQLSQDEFKNWPKPDAQGPQRVKAVWERFDTNKDGMISPAEYEKPANDIFKALDTNKDGKLSPEELNPPKN
ncbi:MAG: EF-hand domain-containing protein [Pseudomonadota bacterium]|nr:EF-hand domain-containing protein [Pseudomonadota bacterium]